MTATLRARVIVTPNQTKKRTIVFLLASNISYRRADLGHQIKRNSIEACDIAYDSGNQGNYFFQRNTNYVVVYTHAIQYFCLC